MHILIINFNLNGISHEDYVSNCNEIAHIFADIPGLISKTWLANESTNTYGGVYFWSSQQSLLDRHDHRGEVDLVEGVEVGLPGTA